ncbi:MAG: mobilization protein [Rhizobacter sp.]|nr:mobilization protein [Rhizobacter sp.]
MATTNIHLIGGEKGGVGKSLMARVLAQYMIDRQLPFLGFDTDRSHGALMRFYSAYASPIEINKVESLDAIVEAAVDQPGRRILVDLAAQTHDSLANWMEEAGVVSLADEMGMKIFYWHVMDTGKDSVDLLRRLLDRFGTGLAYVLVRNQVRGNDFTTLEQSGEQARAIAMGANVVSVKKLNEHVIQQIDANSSSFWQAKADKDGLGLMDRQRVKMWLRDVYREFDDVGV